MFHHMLVKIMNLPRKIQISCPLFELRSGHMVMLQVKVPQVSLIQYSIDDIARASQSGFFVQNQDFV